MPKLRNVTIALLGTAASTLCLGHIAHATLGRNVENLADTLLAVGEMDPGSPQRFRLNGAEFELATHVVAVSPARAVENFLEECDANGALAQGLGVSWSTPRGQNAACIAPPDNVPQGVPLLDRLAQAARTGDLSGLGSLQMLRAMPRPNGSAVVHLRGTGHLPLPAMFPPQGDAMGDDLPGIPRPAGSQRILSALSPRGGQGFVVYRSPSGLIDAQRNYRAAIVQAGLRTRAEGVHLRATTTTGDTFVVSFSARGSATLVTVVTLDVLPER